MTSHNFMSFAQRLLPLQQSQRGAAACRHPAQAVSHALVAVSEHFRRHRRARTLDQLPQFIQSADCRLLADPMRHPGPHILNEAEVWAVCWPALQQAAWSLASHSLRVVCPVQSSLSSCTRAPSCWNTHPARQLQTAGPSQPGLS